MGLLALATALTLWVPALLIVETAQFGSWWSAYPAHSHSFLVVLAFVLPLPLLERDLWPKAESRFGGYLPLLVAACGVSLLLPGRSLTAVLACCLLGVTVVVLWPTSDSNPAPRIAVMGYAIGLCGAVLLLAVEALDFAAPYRMATSLLFRGAPVLLGLAVLCSRLRLRAEQTSRARLNVALALYAAAFGVEFFDAILMRRNWPLALPGLLRAIAVVWLSVEIILAARQNREASGLLRPWATAGLLALFCTSAIWGALAGQTSAHTMHFAYVGAIALLWLLPHQMPAVKTERAFLLAGVALLLLAASTRATAHVWPAIFRSHLLYSAGLALAALACLAGPRWREIC